MTNNNIIKNLKLLQSISDKTNIPFFSFEGKYDIGFITKCYDGDTIHAVIIMQDTAYRFHCRLSGIDTAEIRSSNKEEKEFAVKTKDYLCSLILQQYIWIEFGVFDKYGRLLVTLYMNPERKT